MKFLHIRPVEWFQPDETQPGDFVICNRGGVTIAYGPVGPGEYVVSPAWCNAQDNFNRATGRKVAMERLRSEGPFDIVILDEHEADLTRAIIDWAEVSLFDEPINIWQQHDSYGRFVTTDLP